MKRWKRRGGRWIALGCSLLLACAVTASAGVQGAAEVLERTGGLRMLIVAEDTEPQGTVTVSLPEGGVLQRLRVNRSHEAVSNGLAAGQYALDGSDGSRALISLRENGSVAVLGGDGWTDGEMVHLTREFAGTVQLICYGTAGEHHAFTLEGPEGSYDQVVSFVEDKPQGCSFGGLPAGSYTLWADGQQIQTMTISEQHPVAQLAVSKGKQLEARKVGKS